MYKQQCFPLCRILYITRVFLMFLQETASLWHYFIFGIIYYFSSRMVIKLKSSGELGLISNYKYESRLSNKI